MKPRVSTLQSAPEAWSPGDLRAQLEAFRRNNAGMQEKLGGDAVGGQAPSLMTFPRTRATVPSPVCGQRGAAGHLWGQTLGSRSQHGPHLPAGYAPSPPHLCVETVDPLWGWTLGHVTTAFVSRSA